MSRFLELRGVCKSFQTPVLAEISLQMEKGEIVAVVGVSGGGKTTLLNLIAGIASPTKGEIRYRGEIVSGPSPERAIIFQNHALFPWLTARANIDFALRSVKSRADSLRFLAQVGLEKFADRYPHELSGGMQQRVGIARALAVNPELLLLDEPFASLDVLNREKLLQETVGAVRALGKSMILVTHDIEEAIFAADRLYLLGGTPGRIQNEIRIEPKKPGTVREMKGRAEFLQIERQIHEYLARNL